MPDREPLVTDCSDAQDGTLLQWSTTRGSAVDPRQNPILMLDPIADRLVQAGSVPVDVQPVLDHVRDLTRDGYHLTLSGFYDRGGSSTSSIGLAVYSPCLPNPDR